MKELLLKIHALLSRLSLTEDKPFNAACAVVLGMLEKGDLYAGDPAETAGSLPACPETALGAAYALSKYSEGNVAVLPWEDGSLIPVLNTAVALHLPLIILLPCLESELDDLSGRVMATDIECAFADGRSVIALMPHLRLAIDKAREGDGPTLIGCILDRPPENDELADPLERLSHLLILNGYAKPEELQ